MNTKKYHCTQCNYLCIRNSDLKKHFTTKKHLRNVTVQPNVIVAQDKFKCKVCNKQCNSQQSLWYHKKKCIEVVSVAIVCPSSNSDLRNEIRELTDKITKLVKNQQPTTINNNNNNYINIFLNDRCHNAYDIKKFIAGIDFSKENFEKLIQDYVGGNADIITKNYKSLPEYERPVYVFNGEDEHQKVAHIQYDNKWVVERELGWEKQVRREYNEGTDEPEPNSMYSLVRLFDKKKMEYFDENYGESHLRLSQRKLHKDCLDDGKQLELINKIIDMVSIDPE
jgi:hypothetical protein